MQADTEGASPTPLPMPNPGSPDFEPQAATIKKQNMSDRDDNEDIIRNQDTVARRAWVEWALDSVRRRLQTDEEMPGGTAKAADRPSLFVVRPGRKR